MRCTTDAERIAAYQAASVYLCLSASEGGSYSMADAEAASLRIVTTDCGNADDFVDWVVTPRDDMGVILKGIALARLTARGPSFYERYTFDVWAGLWRQAVEDVRCGSRSALLQV